jgi:hypothetical protein
MATVTTGAMLLAPAVGVAAALEPWATAGGALVAVLIATMAVHPPLSAYLLVSATLLLAGIDRGVAIPLLRPSEAVTLLVAAGVATALVWPRRTTARWQKTVRFHRLDALLLLVAVTASAVPLTWMVVRERDITQVALFNALEMWKYYIGYLVVRLAIRTEREVRVCLWVVVGSACLVALIGILQSLDFFGVDDLVRSLYATESDARDIGEDRGFSTLGSSFAVADTMIFSLGVVAALVLRGGVRAAPLALVAALLGLGVIAAGQVSGVIALVAGVMAFGVATRRFFPTTFAFGVLGLMSVVALWPLIELRLEGFETPSGLPRSWMVRYDNLADFIWPELGSAYNWVTGISPEDRVPAPGPFRDWIYIESGYTWLLWTGGLALFVAFFAFVILALRTTLAVARGRADAVGVAAIASFTAVATLVVLMAFDAHLTMRGGADVSFTLLALALVGRGRSPSAQGGGAPLR